MPKTEEPQGYDVQGTPYRQSDNPIDILGQCFWDYRSPDPGANFTHRTNGNLVTIYYHRHSRGLGDPGRRALEVDGMGKAMDAFLKGLKKRFRELGGGTLDMTERKSARGYDLQKTSLNDRWDIVLRRTYELKDFLPLPEE